MSTAARRTYWFLALIVGAAICACTGSPNSTAPPRPSAGSPGVGFSSVRAPQKRRATRHGVTVDSSIQYVIVIVQENRTLNNLFAAAGISGANTTTSGLTAEGLGWHCDPTHQHEDFLQDADWNSTTNEFANDGWSGAGHTGADCISGPGLTYVSPTPTIYSQLASEYVLATQTFQMNAGPSFPAHQYLIAGQSGGFVTSGNKYAPNDATNGQSWYRYAWVHADSGRIDHDRGLQQWFSNCRPAKYDDDVHPHRISRLCRQQRALPGLPDDPRPRRSMRIFHTESWWRVPRNMGLLHAFGTYDLVCS